MKRSESHNKVVLFAMSTIIFLLQLTVTVTSCFIWAKSLQDLFGKTNIPSVLEWLQSLDGVESKVDEKIFRKTRFLSWFMRKVFVQIAALIEWCSFQYVLCLVVSFSCQALVAFMVKQKWPAETSVNCLMWFTLLITSQQRSPPYFILADVFLSGFACGISLYLLMMFSVGNRMFGRATKTRKMTLEVELRTCRNEMKGIDRETPNYITKKLKLPEELMVAEENYNLDANISSLSLGPLGEDRKRSSRSGTWFGSKSVCPGFNEAGIVTKTHSSSTANSMLIWPARFHMNGLALHSRRKENGMSKAKTESVFQDFSDDELLLFSESEEKNRKKSKESENEIQCQRNDTSTKIPYERCSVLRVILVCSLALNACFLWLLKDTIHKTLLKT